MPKKPKTTTTWEPSPYLSKEALRDWKRKYELQVLQPRHVSKCPVCLHPDKSSIEDRYLSWDESPKQLAERYNVQERAVKAHAKHSGLDFDKVRNQADLYRIIQQKGAEAIQEGLVDPNVAARLALDAAKQMDKVEGRIVVNHNVEATKTIQIVAPPIPGGIIEAKVEEEEIEEAPRHPALPPALEDTDG